MKGFLFAALAAASCAFAADLPPEFEGRWSRVVQDFRETSEREQTVGASLYFFHDGRTVAAEHFGFADLAERRRVDAETIYHWASITKTFTAVAVLQLRDRGILALDESVTKYLPEIEKVHNVYGAMDGITLRHLMTHSSGFRASTFPWGHGEDWYPHEPAEWSQVAAMMPYTEIEFEPGTKCSYSNPGISMLGRIVEIVTGDDIEVYITKNILMPLGMSRSYFDVTPYYLRKYRSNNYFVREGSPEAQGPELDTGATTGNGGLNGPVGDMAKWLLFLAGSGAGDNDDYVLSRESLKEMRTPACSMDIGDLQDWDMGFTLFSIAVPLTNEEAPMMLSGHTGGQKAYNSFVYFDPQSTAAVVYASNTLNDDVPRASSVFRQTRVHTFDRIFSLFRQ